MSGAIKPPGGGPGPIDPSDAAGELTPSEAPAPAEASQGAAQVAESGTAAWLQRVDAGEISAEQAVDGIVAEALSAPGAAHLNATQRAELESLLRAALLDDPTLSALVGS